MNGPHHVLTKSGDKTVLNQPADGLWVTCEPSLVRTSLPDVMTVLSLIKENQMTDKYTAHVQMCQDGNEFLIRFVGLTLGEAKAFMRIFDKFDHVYSDAGLIRHGWELVEKVK